VKVVLLIAATAAIYLSSTAKAEPRQVTIKASHHARAIVATWQCQDRIPVARTKNYYYPWVPHSQAFRMAQVLKWKARLASCQAFLKERARQWNWQVFPSWIIQLVRCESSINWFAEGSSTDGTFYSAFNIGRSRYDIAAHKMGVRGWHEGAGVPSPYEQAMAVIGYVRIFGDGFTGRCAGIARSSW